MDLDSEMEFLSISRPIYHTPEAALCYLMSMGVISHPRLLDRHTPVVFAASYWLDITNDDNAPEEHGRIQ